MPIERKSGLVGTVLGICVATTMAMLGCGGGTAGGYTGPVGTVSGKVTLKGQPVPKGTTVLFQATAKGYLAVGEVGADGQYKLRFNNSESIPAVAYRIQLGVPAPTGPVPIVDPAKIGESKDGNPPPVAPFPEKYASTGTSGLEFTVKAGANTHNIELTE